MPAQPLPLAPEHTVSRSIPELVVVSGKGGTGKTSLVASLAMLAGDVVVADCDVDAADLHLVLEPRIVERHEFWSGHEAVVEQEQCSSCGTCHEVCRFAAVRWQGGAMPAAIDPLTCEGCGVCVELCPEKAIAFPERRCGEWFVSSSRSGPLVHARLGIAAENSGKLVATVRREARRVAMAQRSAAILCDGPPGIGCPVIAAMTGATAVLLVAEPTVSGAHDMRRVLELCRHFDLPAALLVNRWDLYPRAAEEIEREAVAAGAVLMGRVGYDPAVTAAQLAARSVVEHGGRAAADIRELWPRLGAWWLGEKGMGA